MANVSRASTTVTGSTRSNAFTASAAAAWVESAPPSTHAGAGMRGARGSLSGRRAAARAGRRPRHHGEGPVDRLGRGQVDAGGSQDVDRVAVVAGPQEREHVVRRARLVVQHALRERAGPGDPGRVLEDVEALHQVRVGRPGDAGALSLADDLAPEPLFPEVGHDLDQRARGDRLAALDPVVQLELEPGQRRHDEEVAVEVRHRLVDHGDRQLGLGILGQEMGPHQRLVQVRGDLGDEGRVAGVDQRLGVPGEPRVHRVAELVGQDARAAQVLGVVQADERLGERHARREGRRGACLGSGRRRSSAPRARRGAGSRRTRGRAGRPRRPPTRAPARRGCGWRPG